MGGVFRVCESTLRQRNREMGEEMLGRSTEGQYRSCGTSSGKDGHKVVPRVHLLRGGDLVCQRQIEIRGWQELSTISEHGLHLGREIV